MCLLLGLVRRACVGQCVRIAPKRYPALLEWGAVLVQALNALPSSAALAHRPGQALPRSFSGVRPSLLSQQGRSSPPRTRGPFSTAGPAPPPLPTWARDDDDERDADCDEYGAPLQTDGFSFGGSSRGGSPGGSGGKEVVPAESWAEIYRKQRASRRGGAVK